ncbi:hypothetical protein Q3G72_004359 [Acer saccharum]|nr:hypothetical protein Q3G72_004359 [Acer saccharum]
MTKRTERGEDQIVRYVTLACSRGGKARNRSLSVAKRPTGKTECKAKINALRCDEKLRLTTVHNIHNHGLSPKKSRFFRCNREVSDAVKRVLDTNDRAGVRMNKCFGSLVVGAGGFENLPFLEKDCRNYIDKARHLRLGAGGAGALREYFLRMQYKNPRFFALMDLDDDGRCTNVVTPVLNFGHPNKGHPGFFVVLEYLNVASTLQNQCGCPKVRFANDEEDIDDDDDNILTLPIVK